MTTERYKSEPKIILERAVKYSATIKTDQGSLVFDLLTREPSTVSCFSPGKDCIKIPRSIG